MSGDCEESPRFAGAPETWFEALCFDMFVPRGPGQIEPDRRVETVTDPGGTL